jgi:hypothetical protein
MKIKNMAPDLKEQNAKFKNANYILNVFKFGTL